MFENPRGTSVITNCRFIRNMAIMRPYEEYFVPNFVLNPRDFGGGGVIAIRGTQRTILILEKNLYDSNWSSKRGKLFELTFLYFKNFFEGGVLIAVASIYKERFSIFKSCPKLIFLFFFKHYLINSF